MLRKKYIFSLTIVFILIAAFLLGCYFYFVKIHSEKNQHPVYYTTPKVKIFLRNATDKYINCTVTFQVNSIRDLHILKKRESVLQDMLYSFLCNLRLSDLQSGIISMQINEQIKKRVNTICPGSVKEIYIKEMIIE